MCSNCKVTYYGKTFRLFYIKVAEHMLTSNLTGKCLKNVKQSAISDHLLQCNYTVKFDDFDILAADPNKLLLRECLLIKHYRQEQDNKIVSITSSSLIEMTVVLIGCFFYV